ncbi:hypothetical protein GJ744_007694 [Endocarpon pusillum]|uniref:Oxidoreductase AflY n=1 Tax=Endocarpon pusillum TaxID=364733 RepID=A0A8H7E9W6_9EURO|nr:hypothetical protein GJ744_007694 [Endocarpon pusillum]
MASKTNGSLTESPQRGPPKLYPQPTPYNIQLSPSETPGRTHVEELSHESAEKVSELLMLNHVQHHTLFDEVGFHNHIVHHLLTLWALGATPSEIQAAYDLNKPYQFLTQHHATSVSVKLKEPEFFNECLGKPKFYGDFLKFFQDKIAEHGVPNVVNEYIFKGDGRADNLFGRMHSGILHPLIHLGIALEFHQPCLVAESLAAACIHDDWPVLFLLPAEKFFQSNPETQSECLLSIIDDLRNDPIVSNAVKPSDPPNKIRHGLLKRASKELIPHLAKFQVSPTPQDLAKKTVETIQVSAYLCGAAQNPDKVEAIDFIMMHMTTLSIFYPTFMEQDWISNENKKRMLEWKGRSDAVIYAGCGCPRLYAERIINYTPKRPQDGWQEVIQRANRYADDGHTSKLIRALLNAGNISEPILNAPGLPLNKGDFFKIAHMVIDAVERMLQPGYYKMTERVRKIYAVGRGQHDEVVRIFARWVRWCGLEGAWDDVPDLEEKAGEMPRIAARL